MICNDTGISHVAAAVGTPSVVVSSGSDVARWAPLDAARHRVLWQPMACRPCSHAVCPIGHACATAIGVDEVLQAVAAQRRLDRGSTTAAFPLRGRAFAEPPAAATSVPGTATASTVQVDTA